MAADKHGIVNTKNPGFQYRCNGHSISHDIKSIEDKIAANLHACEWVKNFVNAKNPIDKKDIYLKKIIPYSINKLIHKKNEDLIEYDIRKDFLNRAYFWIFCNKKVKISKKRIFLCILKAIKYKYNF